MPPDDPNKADLSTLAPGASGDPPPPPPPAAPAPPAPPAPPEAVNTRPHDPERDDKPKPNSEAKAADVDKEAGISTAKGSSEGALGDQVSPETQTSEADGHRTLMKPVTDPGPYMREGGVNVKNPDRSKGEHRYRDANEPLDIMQRTSTGHDLGYGKPAGEVVNKAQLAPDLAISGAASDCYHPTDGKETSLTADAEAKANAAKELAPVHE